MTNQDEPRLIACEDPYASPLNMTRWFVQTTHGHVSGWSDLRFPSYTEARAVIEYIETNGINSLQQWLRR